MEQLFLNQKLKQAKHVNLNYALSAFCNEKPDPVRKNGDRSKQLKDSRKLQWVALSFPDTVATWFDKGWVGWGGAPKMSKRNKRLLDLELILSSLSLRYLLYLSQKGDWNI